MPYIYKITNDINNKIYIGKTVSSIKQRWQEHCNEYKRKRAEKRPLYSAMNKYGIEHFHIELIEECTNDILNDREIYWIEYFGSFKYGYNATKGGDGKTYCDYDLIYALYKEGLTIKQISDKLHYDYGQCSKILSSFGITKKEKQSRASQKQYRPVIQMDKNTNEIINIFPSVKMAENFTGNGRHIASVCNGKRKTAAGYKWKWANVD